MSWKNSFWFIVWRQIRRNKLAMASLVIIIFYTVIAIAVAMGWIAAHPNQRVAMPYEAPSLQHPLGADVHGRDIFTQVIYGTRIAMGVGLITSIIAIPIGVVLGCIAGYFGGWVDECIVWLYSTVAAIPGLLLIMALSLVFGRGLTGMYVSIGLATWVSLCRLIRGETLKLKNQEFVQAAQVIGVSRRMIIARHIVPNIMHLVIIYFALQFVFAIKTEVILSYIGIGVQDKPSWGLIIQQAQNRLFMGDWYGFAGATVAMFLIVLALNLFSDGLRDASDPKFKV